MVEEERLIADGIKAGEGGEATGIDLIRGNEQKK